MSDSEEEEEVLYFGTPLDPYDEDAFPKKRPIPVEDQVAKDAQGRRRFHGAFTGGFSAGFFNTVGSLEGWRPAEFKSSRSDKARNQLQRPEDFMDDEDVGEFGIAHQTVKATEDYAKKKRKKQIFSDGPIPGDPVLETLLEAGNETVGYFLMKNMNRRRKPKEAPQNEPKVYGCVMPTDEPLDLPQYDLHEVYSKYLATPKSNTFGLGYVGLDKSHFNLFQPAKLTVRERNNKKLSISGQAFGVGAFEDDDEDIYVKEDMSRYDFEMTAESSKKANVETKTNLILDAFVMWKVPLTPCNEFPPPVIPNSFTGKHNVKRSRFEPIIEKEPERRNLDATIRATYLNEDGEKKNYTPSNTQHKPKDRKSEELKRNSPVKDKSVTNSLLIDRFVSAKQEDDVTNLLAVVEPTEVSHGTKEMHAAVKMKMFGPLTRVTLTWQPNAFLCKRFNVPEPHCSELDGQKNRKRTKNLIFEYQKHLEFDSLDKPGLNVQKIETPAPTEEVEPLKPEVTSVCAIPLPDDPSVSKTTTVDKPTSQAVLDGTERVNVSQNTDLFKAIFLSSSESESENEVEQEKVEEKERQEILAANVVSEPLVPKIRSTKDGILSNIDFSKFQRKVETNADDVVVETKTPIDDNVYGPKLPVVSCVSFIPVIPPTNVRHTDKWVEKDSSEKQKKHKKHKKKHKKKSKK